MGCVVHWSIVWVLFCHASVFVLLGGLGVWGRGGLCVVVGVRWGESVGCCIGLGESVDEKGRDVVCVVGCDDVCLQILSLLAITASLISRGC